MDRPKHRRFVFLGMTLLAGGALLLLGRQWSSSPEPAALPAREPTAQQRAPEIDRAKPIVASEATQSNTSTPAASPTQSSTGLRGRIVDAITRQPVKEFTVRLERIEREGGGTIRRNEPIARRFASDTGRFAWDVAAGYWLGAVQAPGYQQFNLEEQQFSADKPTRELVMPLQRGLVVRGRVFDQSTGAGLPEARIGIRKASTEENGREMSAPAQPQADGSFTLDGVPAGDIVLSYMEIGRASCRERV